jgi:hypothetical protein
MAAGSALPADDARDLPDREPLGGSLVPIAASEDGERRSGSGQPRIVIPTGPPGQVSAVERLTPLQEVASQLTRGLLIVLSLLLLGVGWDWLTGAPRAPDALGPPQIVASTPAGPAGAPDAVATAITNYRALNEAVAADYKARSDTYVEGRLKLLDAGPIKILVPLITLLLGYLFGIQSGRGGT